MKNVTALLLTVLLILPIAMATQTFAPKVLASRIYIDPSANVYDTNNATVGTLFNVTIKIDDVPPTPSLGDPTIMGAAAWQIYLEFNDTILRVARWYEPASDPTYLFYGKTTTPNPVPPDPGYVHLGTNLGRVSVASNLFPTPPAQNGSSGAGPFKLAILTFNITQLPDNLSGLFTSSLHFGLADTFLLDVDGNTMPGFALEDGSYAISFAPPAPPAPHVWLQTSPSTYNTDVPTVPFNVSVSIMNVSASDFLVGIQFEMLYNSSFLEFKNSYNGSFLDPYATHGTLLTIINEPYPSDKFSRVVFGQILLPNDTGFYDQTVWPSGSGEIATLTFQPTVRSNYSAMLTPASLFGESFLNYNGDYISAGTPLGTAYTYTNPPEPTITVSPNPVYASAVGEIFPINLTIANLDARWQLTNIAFRLSYDSTTLNATGATEGSFMSSFGNTTFTAALGPDYVDISIQVTPSGPFPSGAGTLAIVNFNATVGPPASRSDLKFSNQVLLDSNGLADSAIWIDGTYVMHQRLVHPIVVGLTTYDVITVSDAAVTPVPMVFDPDHRMLYFNVTGLGIPHFVDVMMPDVLISASPDKWLAIVGGSNVTVTGTPVNATHTTVTVNFNFTSQSVFLFGTTAIPEISPSMMPLLLVLASLLSVGVAGVARSKRKRFTILE